MSVVDLNADFDWFACDTKGCFALFATGGEGFVPPTVVEFHVMHETVAGSIEYPNWGTPQLWQDVARLGLYVYDWSSEDGCYRQMAQPSSTSEVVFAEMVERIDALPTLPTAFADTEVIIAVSAFEAPNGSGQR